MTGCSGVGMVVHVLRPAPVANKVYCMVQTQSTNASTLALVVLYQAENFGWLLNARVEPLHAACLFGLHNIHNAEYSRNTCECESCDVQLTTVKYVDWR
jgi:hypothetical protein